MFQKLRIMLLSSAQKITYYAFENCPFIITEQPKGAASTADVLRKKNHTRSYLATTIIRNVN